MTNGRGELPDSGPPEGSYKTDSLEPYIISRVSEEDDKKVTDAGDSEANISQETGVQKIIPKEEMWWQTLIQITIPFLIAGIGTIGAGVILGNVKTWEVFESISELFILVPALLGLKGNLDMTLAARLSTQANLGNMSSKKKIVHMVVGNIALVQVQATVASFLVSCFASGIGAIFNSSFLLEHAFLITASAMFTATISCFILDFILSGAIILCDKFKINPDNMATPLAAAIGDVVTITMLSLITSIIYANLATYLWVTYVIIGVYFLLLPCWILVVLRNQYVRPVLKSGWVPVLSALLISGLGGLVLQQAVDDFNGFAVFSPIMNGIAGSLVSVQACRTSTLLYQTSELGVFPYFAKIFVSPWKALIRGTPYAKVARLLILIAIPGQTIFIFLADFIHMGKVTIGAAFVFSYLIASLISISLLLYISHVITHAFWKCKIDPDTSTIPYLTALGDLFGSSLLLAAFFFLRAVNREYEGRTSEEAEEFYAGFKFYGDFIDLLLSPTGVCHIA